MKSFLPHDNEAPNFELRKAVLCRKCSRVRFFELAFRKFFAYFFELAISERINAVGRVRGTTAIFQILTEP